MSYGYIYKVTHEPSGRFYIGQRVCRKGGKIDESYWGSGAVWKKILKKYPLAEFTREVLAFADNPEVLNQLEEVYVGDLFETDTNCVNLKSGGDQFIFSDDVKKRISVANTGEKNGMYGKKHSEETKKKIAQKHTGMRASDATKQKLSEMRKGKRNPMYGTHRFGKENPMYGKKQTDEVKQRISECNTGEKNGMYGKQMSEKAKREIGLKNGKPVMCVETGVVYSSAREAERCTGVRNASISLNISGKYKSAGGFRWVFVPKKKEAEQE